MPTLLPRESMDTTSVIPVSIQRPSPSDHRVGSSISFTRLLIGSLALRPALLLFGNSQPRVTTTPLPHATGAHGQFPGRDFNPLDLLLLLRTVKSCFLLIGAVSQCDSPAVIKIGKIGDRPWFPSLLNNLFNISASCMIVLISPPPWRLDPIRRK
jgi:hypothetical protein